MGPTWFVVHQCDKVLEDMESKLLVFYHCYCIFWLCLGNMSSNIFFIISGGM
jgi:hypothetical protein